MKIKFEFDTCDENQDLSELYYFEHRAEILSCLIKLNEFEREFRNHPERMNIWTNEKQTTLDYDKLDDEIAEITREVDFEQL